MNDQVTLPVQPSVAEWKAIVARFQKSSLPRAIWQLVNTFGLYGGIWYVLYLTLGVSWWLTIALAALAGVLLVRVFIIFHDCGHGSFFKSRLANDIVGFISGVLTFTPYYHWRWEHALHHATTGDLDRRGVGDIWTMTVEEYLSSTRWKRFAYRLARNPFVLFVVAPVYLFVFQQRLSSSKANPRERWSVWWMNLAIAGYAIGLSLLFGFWHFFFIQLTITMVAGASGVWLFYVQHQYEDAYWESHEEWDFTAAALSGSSFYKLPRILQWLSGNIGYHHIHHLSSRIPNYNLERCHNSHPVFETVKPITVRSSLKSIKVRLWDEKMRKLVGFRHIKHRPRRRPAEGDSVTVNEDRSGPDTPRKQDGAEVPGDNLRTGEARD